MTLFDTVLQAVATYASSPWFYLAVGMLVALDAVVPVLPGESVLIACGVLAGAGGDPGLVPVVVAGGMGAALGSAVSFGIGRRHGPRILSGDTTSRRRRLTSALDRRLRRNGSGAVVVAHFLPGGRNVVALLCGATGYGLRRFAHATAAGAALWATTATCAGYLGGTAFADQPLLAFGLPLAVAVLLTVLLGAAREGVSGHHTPLIKDSA